jgi:hypothetical protein
MSLINEISQHFPYQVALSFDEDATGVLEWLDARSFPWDMYVDIAFVTPHMRLRSAAASGSCAKPDDLSEGRAVAGSH